MKHLSGFGIENGAAIISKINYCFSTTCCGIGRAFAKSIFMAGSNTIPNLYGSTRLRYDFRETAENRTLKTNIVQEPRLRQAPCMLLVNLLMT